LGLADQSILVATLTTMPNTCGTVGGPTTGMSESSHTANRKRTMTNAPPMSGPGRRPTPFGAPREEPRSTPYSWKTDKTPTRNEATVTKPNRTPVKKAPDDDALAWKLAATARPHLSRPDADRIYIAIGIGETFTAIDALLTAIARQAIPLGDDLVATLATWLDCYRGQDTEPRLRHLLVEMKTMAPHRISAAKDPPGPVPEAKQYRHRRSDQ